MAYGNQLQCIPERISPGYRMGQWWSVSVVSKTQEWEMGVGWSMLWWHGFATCLRKLKMMRMEKRTNVSSKRWGWRKEQMWGQKDKLKLGILTDMGHMWVPYVSAEKSEEMQTFQLFTKENIKRMKSLLHQGLLDMQNKTADGNDGNQVDHITKHCWSLSLSCIKIFRHIKIQIMKY